MLRAVRFSNAMISSSIDRDDFVIDDDEYAEVASRSRSGDPDRCKQVRRPVSASHACVANRCGDRNRRGAAIKQVETESDFLDGVGTLRNNYAVTALRYGRVDCIVDVKKVINRHMGRCHKPRGLVNEIEPAKLRYMAAISLMLTLGVAPTPA